jgi:hypothetical protein
LARVTFSHHFRLQWGRCFFQLILSKSIQQNVHNRIVFCFLLLFFFFFFLLFQHTSNITKLFLSRNRRCPTL